MRRKRAVVKPKAPDEANQEALLREAEAAKQALAEQAQLREQVELEGEARRKAEEARREAEEQAKQSAEQTRIAAEEALRQQAEEQARKEAEELRRAQQETEQRKTADKPAKKGKRGKDDFENLSGVAGANCMWPATSAAGVKAASPLERQRPRAVIRSMASNARPRQWSKKSRCRIRSRSASWRNG